MNGNGRVRPKTYEFPCVDLLREQKEYPDLNKDEIFEKKRGIEKKFWDFGIEGEVKEYHLGPVVTTFVFFLSYKAKINPALIISLAEDLSLALGAESIRIQRIPGRTSFGIEIPNNKREIVRFVDVLETNSFRDTPSKLAFGIGKTTVDQAYVTDLAKMPHLLIGGATGTGKSVCLHALIASILFKASPDEVKLLLIDPKRLEFSLYNDIPHLLAPVIKDSRKAVAVLFDAVRIMEERFDLFGQRKVRNLEEYNQHLAAGRRGKKDKPLPHIVIVVDELAELSLFCGEDVDFAVGRLALLARAVGIHLVLATQRPSMEVITGTIKNSIASRIAFRVGSKIDSRVILDTDGAETLLGMGDMLFITPTSPRSIRLHGSYISLPEIRRLVNFVKKQGKPHYDKRIVGLLKKTSGADFGGEVDKDAHYDEAVRLILHTGQSSASYLQRKFKIGFNRASRIIDQMETEGIVGPSEGSRPREILVNLKEYLEREIKIKRIKRKGGQ